MSHKYSGLPEAAMTPVLCCEPFAPQISHNIPLTQRTPLISLIFMAPNTWL